MSLLASYGLVKGKWPWYTESLLQIFVYLYNEKELSVYVSFLTNIIKNRLQRWQLMYHFMYCPLKLDVQEVMDNYR